MSSHTSYEHMTLRELKALAEVRLLPGWHEMPKAEIVRRLTENAKNASKKGKKASAKHSADAGKTAAPKAPRGASGQTAPAAERKTGASAAKQSKNTVKSSGKSAGKQTPEAKPPKKGTGKKTPEAPVTEAAAKKKENTAGKSKKPAAEAPAAPVSKGNETGKSPAEHGGPSKTAKGRARKQPEVPAEEEMKRAAKPQPAKQEEPKAETGKPARKRSEPPVKEEPEEIESIQVRSDQERLRRALEAKQLRNTLATPQIDGQEPGERLVLTAMGPYWLRVWWEISQKMVQKARSVLGRDWFAAEPVLRLMRGVPNSIGNLRWEIFSEQKIVGGVFNWFLKVDDPPQTYQVEIGYRYKNSFYSLLTSNTVETPENYEQEGMSPQTGWLPRYDTGRYPRGRGRFGGGSIVLDEEDIAGIYDTPFNLTVDAEVIIKGTTSPNARLTIRDKPVRVEPDGSFWVPYRLPERRHIFQVVASAVDGTQSRTIVMAIDRNTKELETAHDYPEE